MAAASAVRLSFPQPDIALLTLDLPEKGANVLSRAVLEELAARLDELEQRGKLAGLVIKSGKPGSFIAGADLREFAENLDASQEEVVEICRRGQTLFARLANLPFVTVAAIDGICVGGGLELASWCDRRVLSDNIKTSLGFPEVKLGLFPGWGGTIRAPRLAGLGNAVEMITTGENIDAAAAKAMGYADDVTSAEMLDQAAIAMVRAERASGAYLENREQWAGPLPVEPTELGFLGATASALIQQETKGNYPAPMAALELMLEAAGDGLDAEAALLKEAEGMAGLFGSPVNRALLNIFFLTDRNKKDRGVENAGIAPADINRAGVIGAGIMGSGIAAAAVKREIAVVLSDARPESLASGAQEVLRDASYDKATKGHDADRAVRFAAFLNQCTADAELAPCDLVIEAVVENAGVKRELYSRIEPLLRDDAILASNTSTIPISRLAEGLRRPESFCGIHFFNPVRRMKLVEVIRGRETSDQTVVTAVAFAKRLGKSPIVCNDGPGFLVNRLLLPYMNEALELLAEGASIKEIDRAAKVFGMPMGPIALYDMVGLDTALYAGKTMAEAFPERVGQSPILPALVEAGRLGKKSGRGFFNHQTKKGRPVDDPDLLPLIEPHFSESQRKISAEEITGRLFLPMLLEATRVLEENIVRDPRDVDLGLIFGVGFPPFKGGLLFWADQVGAKQLREQLSHLEHLGPRFRPTPMLEEMAKTGATFYGPKRRSRK